MVPALQHTQNHTMQPYTPVPVPIHHAPILPGGLLLPQPKGSKIDGKELIKLNCQGAGENATAKRADPSAQRTRGGRARERCKENKRLLTNINISLKCFTAHSYMDSTTHTHACSLARSHLFRLVYRSQRLGDPVAMHFTPLAVRSAPCSLMQRCPRWKMVSA